MSKLHELLAVETDLEGTYKRIVEEATNTFSKKPDHFQGFIKKLEMFDEAKSNENIDEYKEMTTTVDDKLEYVSEHAVRYIDAVLQKEIANQNAVADLIVNGKLIASALPATFLLGLENKLKQLRLMYNSIPTLQPGIKWVEDENIGKGVYVTDHPDVKFKTAKTIQHKVLVNPTDKHPAQIDKWEEQTPVGKYTTLSTSGMLTPARKSELLGRVDKLIQACKQARQRANCVEVENVTIAKDLIDFINK